LQPQGNRFLLPSAAQSLVLDPDEEVQQAVRS
jgi:hypothetical protein